MLNSKLWKSGIFALLMAFMLIGRATPAQAMDHDDERCEKRIHNAEEELHKAERKHGEHSHQAEDRRRKLEEERERCHRDHHDHDHDRDHDHR